MNRLLGSALIVIGVGLLLLGFLGWLNFTLVFNLVVRGIAPPPLPGSEMVILTSHFFLAVLPLVASVVLGLAATGTGLRIVLRAGRAPSGKPDGRN